MLPGSLLQHVWTLQIKAASLPLSLTLSFLPDNSSYFSHLHSLCRCCYSSNNSQRKVKTKVDGAGRGSSFWKSTPADPSSSAWAGPWRSLSVAPLGDTLPGMMQELHGLTERKGCVCKCLSFASKVSKTEMLLTRRIVFKAQSEDRVENFNRVRLFGGPVTSSATFHCARG